MFRSFPMLRLLLPYITGLLWGLPALVGWTLWATLTYKNRSATDADQAAGKLIPLCMALAGALMVWTPAPPAREERLVEMTGTLRDGPWTVYRYGRETRLLLDADQRSRGRSMEVVLRDAPDIALLPGDRIALRGRLLYLGERPVVRTRTGLVEKKGEDRGCLLLRGTYLLRCRLWQGLSLSLERRAAALTAAMLLGLSHTIDPATKALFRRTGTAHLLAISGLHMGLIYLLAVALLARFGLEGRPAFWPLLLFLGAYVLISGCRLPVLRAFLVCSLYLYAARIHRRPEAFDLLFNACLLILVMQPTALREVSFQLSFAGYGAILCFLKRARLCGVRQYRGMETRPRSWRGSYRRYAGKLFFLFAFSLASWLGTLPLTLHYFQRLVVWAPLINVAAFPLFMAALVSGALHLFVVLLGLPCTVLTAWPVNTAVSLLCGTLDRLSALPPSDLMVPAPPVWAVAAGYTTLFGLFLITGRMPRREDRADFNVSDRGPLSSPRT